MKSSDKKTLTITIIIILITAGGVFIYNLIKNIKKKEEENNELKNRLNESENGRINLLKEHISKSEQPELIQEGVLSLIKYYSIHNNDVALELQDANTDLKNKNQAEAARKIGLVLENILREQAKMIDFNWYEKNTTPKRKPMLNALLKWAKEKNIFNETEFNLGIVVLEFRNTKSHEPNVNNKTTYNQKALAIHAGVELIHKFSI